jgi:sporulation-control protein spo0M
MKIRVDEQQNVPFSFQLPFDTPVLFGGTKVWLNITADVPMILTKIIIH